MLEAIGGLLAIILLIANEIIKTKHDKKRQHDKDIEKMGTAIAGGDSNTITELFDELRIPTDPDNTGRSGS